MAKDLRTFLDFLDKKHPEHIYHVTTEVNPEFEVTGVLAKLEEEKRFPVVVFHNVKGGTGMPVVTNVHADFKRMAMAIDLPPDVNIIDFTNEYERRESKPIDPVLISSEEAPVHEVVWKGDEVDLNKLPLLKYHETDGGFYITAAFIIMKDPDTGIRNLGIYRLMRQRKNEMGIQFSQTAHGHFIMKKHRERGTVCQFAAMFGHHPAFYTGGQSFVPYGVDELTISGPMLGEPVRIVKCKTIDAEVPADAEIVLECEMRPDEFREEAPFGEYPGTVGPMRMNPVVHVKAITMRKDAYYQSCFVGHPENLLLGGGSRLGANLRTARIASPNVTAVNMPLSGRCRFICYAAMHKMVEGEPKNVAMAIFASDPYVKFVFVVDDDVDIMDDSAVMHAVATRLRADTDVFVVKNARGSPLDPASYDPRGGSHLVTKVGIDATRKVNRLEEIVVPGVDKINLADYLKLK